ncbi:MULTISPECIES: hypothetical protein [unclassified Desulfovibrio]|uniref:hypothetical protein n=1 Tax=unclassified Desulfovibrio TaxID=2593640 RepID=UPI002FD94383
MSSTVPTTALRFYAGKRPGQRRKTLPGSSPLEHFAFETLPVSTHHSGEKRGFRQNPRHLVAAAAFASAEQFQSEIALKFPTRPPTIGSCRRTAESLL